MYKLGTLDDLLSAIVPGERLYWDMETVGLYGTIRLSQFYQESWDKVLIVEKPNPVVLMATLARLKNEKLAGHVLHYDITTVQAQTGSRFVPAQFDDTYYLARLAYPYAEELSLDAVMTVVLGYDPYKRHNIVKKDMQGTDWGVPVLSDKQYVYAAIDVFYLPAVFKAVEAFTTDINYKLDMHNVRKALDFQNEGMPVLLDAIEQRYSENMQAIAELAIPINVNSYIQVPQYTGTSRSDALTLATAALQGNERAGKVLAAKKLHKQNSFLNKFNVPEQRIYGKFQPSARSGRYTCKDQNLQQLPRKLKGCFGVAPDSGRVLLYADYPQLELRTIAAITQERILIELFQKGGDPHAYVAELLFGKDWTKDDRQITKTYNFNLLYCGGASMVQSIFIKDSNILRDLDIIKRDVKKWKSAWPAISRWQEETVKSHRRGSLKQTPFGRRYIGKLLTDHANIENQGFGADVAKLALHYMYDDLKANGAVLCNFIHDSYIVEMDRDETANRRVARIMRDAMKDAWSEACKMTVVKDIPMPAQVMCGFNWGAIEEGDFLFKEQ